MIKVSDVKQFLNTITVENYLTDSKTETLFDEYYLVIFNKINFCKGCSNDIDMAIVRLKKEVSKQDDNVELTRNMTEAKYKFKKEVRLYSNSLKMVVTKFNLTDAIAEKLIAENSKHIDLFDITEVPVAPITIEALTELKTTKKGRKKKTDTLTAL